MKNSATPDFDAQEFAIGMIEATLRLNPENKNLSSDELRRMAIEDFRDSMRD